jgi:hypothetical protein
VAQQMLSSSRVDHMLLLRPWKLLEPGGRTWRSSLLA